MASDKPNRNPRLYLAEIVKCCENVRGFHAGKSEREFLGSDLLQRAVMAKLTIIGEAASKVPAEVRERYAKIPWSTIVASRNALVHGYFGTNWPRVWKTATEDLPHLKQQMESMLNDLSS